MNLVPAKESCRKESCRKESCGPDKTDIPEKPASGGLCIGKAAVPESKQTERRAEWKITSGSSSASW